MQVSEVSCEEKPKIVELAEQINIEVEAKQKLEDARSAEIAASNKVLELERNLTALRDAIIREIPFVGVRLETMK